MPDGEDRVEYIALRSAEALDLIVAQDADAVNELMADVAARYGVHGLFDVHHILTRVLVEWCGLESPPVPGEDSFFGFAIVDVNPDGTESHVDVNADETGDARCLTEAARFLVACANNDTQMMSDLFLAYVKSGSNSLTSGLCFLICEYAETTRTPDID